jgi:hypothetical protein
MRLVIKKGHAPVWWLKIMKFEFFKNLNFTRVGTYKDTIKFISTWNVNA